MAKIDSEFFNKFISECLQKDKTSSEEIIDEAECRISEIEEKIKEVEELKIVRKQLMRIVNNFAKRKPRTTIDDVKNLELLKLENKHICDFICEKIENNSININELFNNFYSNEDIIFCVKQLLKNKVICKYDNAILKGKRYDNYMETIRSHMTREQAEALADRRAREILGVNDRMEAFRMLDNGELYGTGAEVVFRGMRHLLG